MARTATLTVLLSDVRTKGDFAGATIRHTDAQITRLLNQSIQRFRERISNEGSTRYLVSSTGTLGVGPTSPFPFYQLDLSGLSPALVRTYGIDVTFPGGDVRTLDHVPFEMRAKYGTNLQGSEPQAWAHFKSDQVAILPASSTAYAYTVWYLPVIADLVNGSDTFDGVAGWEDFIVWDVVVQLIARDQFPQAYGIAATQRDGVWADILRGATKVSQAGGAHLGRDSFGGKLPLFLGGRRPQKTAAGGPMVPAPGSVTDAMLANMTGPSVKGVLSGTTRPYSVGIATLTTYLSTFSTTQRGLVPPPLGVGGLYLDDSGTWSAPAGGGGGGSVGPSGAIQYQAGTGMAGASGFRIHGLSGPSLIAHLDGTLRVTGGSVDVGSGTVRISPSGIDVGGGSVINVGTLVASALAAPTVTDTAAGLAPASGGGTTNFLRADGTWQAPPGGSSTPGGSYDAPGSNTAGGSLQYHNAAGTFGGTVLSRVRIQENSGGSGVALGFGLSTPSAIDSSIAVTTNFLIHGQSASGTSLPFLNWREAGGGGAGFSGAVLFLGNNSNAGQGIQANVYRTASGGFHLWQMGGSSGLPHLRLEPTGLDASTLHVRAKSFSVATGLGLDQLQPVGSGMVLGNLSGTGTPSPVAVATLHAFAPKFTSSNPGTVPESGGGTANFLRADGTWTTPAAGAAVPSGITGSIQFNNAGAFEGATGIRVVASGQALAFGANPAATGTLRFSIGDGIHVPNTLGGTSRAIYTNGDDIGIGEPSGTLGIYHQMRPGVGAMHVSWGASDKYVFNQNQADFTPALNLATGLTNANLHPMASGTVKGNLGPTGAPSDVSIPTLLHYSPTFTSTRPGYVPPSGGGTTNFLRADGTWTTPAAGAAVPSGIDFSVQFNNGGAFGGMTGVRAGVSGTSLQFGANPAATGAIALSDGGAIYARQEAGNLSSRLLHAGGIDQSVGDGNASGTRNLYHDVRPGGLHIFRDGFTDRAYFQGSGLFMQNGGIVNAAALVVSSGIGNAFLDPIGSGMFKGRISGTGAVQDVALQTMLAFAPTFTATKQGVVPPSGGGTANFLRADGTWTTPAGGPATPGGGPNSIQFNNAGTTDGASGFGFSSAGGALGIGVPSFLPGAGDFRVASGFNITANLPSGIGGVAARQVLFDWSGGGASGVLKVGGASGILGTNRNEVATGGAHEWLIGGQTGMSLRATGLDASQFHVRARSLDVLSINGLPADANQLKRGLDIGNSSGLPSGLSLYLPRGAASGANRYIIPSGAAGTGTQAAPRFVTLNPTGGRGGSTIRIEKVSDGGWPFEVRTPTGTVLHSFPSGAKGVADFVFEKPSGAVFQLGGFGDLY